MPSDYPVCAFRLHTKKGRLRRVISVRTTTWANMQRWLERTRASRSPTKRNNLWIEEETRPAVFVEMKRG